MVELPKIKKEPILAKGKDPVEDTLAKTKEPEADKQPTVEKPEVKEPVVNDQAKVEKAKKKSKPKKIEDDHLIRSKDDPFYRPLLKTTDIDGVIEVLEDKKNKIDDTDQKTKIEKAEKKLKKLNKTVEKITEIYSKENNEEERREYIKKLIEEKKDPFEPLKNVRDRRVVNMITRLMLKDPKINNFFVDYFGEQASFNREEWLLETSQNTGSEELKESINDVLEQIREAREKQKTEETPYFDLVTFLLSLQKAEEGLKKPDNNNLEQILENINLDQLKYELETYIINDPDQSDKYPAIVSFYNECLVDDLTPESLANVDAEALIKELESFVDDYTSKEGNDQNNIATIIELLNELKAAHSPDKDDKDGGGDKATTESTEATDSKNVVPGFWSTMWALAKWKGLETVFSFATGLLFAPVTAAIWASKQRIDMKKGGANVDLSGLDELWHPFGFIKESADKKPEDKKDKKK